MRTSVNPLTGKVSPKEKYYINPDELRDEIVRSQEEHKCSEKLGQMLMTITEKVYALPKFKNVSFQDKQEMASWNLMRWMKCGIWKIDINNNVFSYITRGTEMNGYRWLKMKASHEERERKYYKFIIDNWALSHNGEPPEILERMASPEDEEENEI